MFIAGDGDAGKLGTLTVQRDESSDPDEDFGTGGAKDRAMAAKSRPSIPSFNSVGAGGTGRTICVAGIGWTAGRADTGGAIVAARLADGWTPDPTVSASAAREASARGMAAGASDVGIDGVIHGCISSSDGGIRAGTDVRASASGVGDGNAGC
jgi:hypothetical protein